MYRVIQLLNAAAERLRHERWTLEIETSLVSFEVSTRVFKLFLYAVDDFRPEEGLMGRPADRCHYLVAAGCL